MGWLSHLFSLGIRARKWLPKLLIVFPTLLDMAAAILTIVCALKSRWWVKILIFLVLLVICAVLCLTVLYPYIAEPGVTGDATQILGKIF